MKLNEIKLNVDCVITEINISDEKVKTRLMELGLNEGTIVRVIKKSVLKKTLLIVFHSSCFTLKDNLSNQIVVKYA